LAKVFWEIGRRIVQRVFNSIEPDDPDEMPRRIKLGRDEYRRNRKTPGNVFCLFGQITLRRFIYQAVQPGEPGLFPLQHALGMVARLATPALADQVGRLAADLPQQQTLGVLQDRFGVRLSVGSLRKITAAMAQSLAPLQHDALVHRLLTLLQKAFDTRGKHRPALVVGRDGVMVQTRPCWEEASTATVSVYDRRGDRVGTVYLGRMPEGGQATMSDQLTRLITDVLAGWKGTLPRLHYVTDAGHHPQEFFHCVLRLMKHPRTGKRLGWTWAVDFFHAAERVTTIAEAIFGPGRDASAWAEKMRAVMKKQRAGPSRVVQSARALRRSRGLQGSPQPFDQAVAYLKKYRNWMDYTGHRRVGLPIGSGVTEAACKTIVGHRFKQSGMRWESATGQHVLDLRVILKSAIWPAVRTAWLADFTPCQAINLPPSSRQPPGYARVFALPP